jgi:hypothetical protein
VAHTSHGRHEDHPHRTDYGEHLSVMPLIHARGAGVIGKASEFNLAVRDAHDTLNHSDVDSRSVEYTALFRMEFQICRDIAGMVSGFFDAHRVAANAFYTLGKRCPIGSVPGKSLRRETTCVTLTTGQTALLIAPYHCLQWVAAAIFVLSQGLSDFNRRKGPQPTIVLSTVWNRVDV